MGVLVTTASGSVQAGVQSVGWARLFLPVHTRGRWGLDGSGEVPPRSGSVMRLALRRKLQIVLKAGRGW